MIATIISQVIRHKTAILALLGLSVGLSVYSIVHAPLDAIPDISDPQIVVYAKWPRSPQLLETEITEPLTRALLGSKGVASLRGTSHMGYAFIYVILNGSEPREKVAQAVLDRIAGIRPQLPPDAAIALGPNASSVGWIYQYALLDKEKSHDLRELRVLNDTLIKSAIQTVPGVAEVASVGGLEKQYQIKIFPPLLAKTGVTLRDLIMSLQSAFEETGGRTLEVTNRDYQLRGSLAVEDISNLDYLVIARSKDGAPIRLKDVGYVQSGYDQRRSTVDLDGEGEVVGSVVIMAQDQNVLAITRALEQKLKIIRAALPKGVEIVTTYDRSEWIWATLREFFKTLGIEIVVLILVTLLFLQNARTSLGPIAILLLSTVLTALPLALFKQTINLFSLAGLCIAIGEIADATIVIVENCTAELALHPNSSPSRKREILIQAIARVTKPLLFSLLIILASFLPVFFFEQREARLFDPLAYSKTFAMVFSTLLTLFMLPVFVVWIFQGRTAERGINFLETRMVALYRQGLRSVIRYRYVFTIGGMLTLIPAAVVLTHFSRDFLPEADEGSILYMPTTLPGLPNKEAGWVLQQMDRKLKKFPEVERVFGKIGRADTSTDPAPLTMIETTILLKPKSNWRRGMTRDRLVAEMDQSLQTIGYVNAWVQPIRARFMMQSSGIQTPVGLKIKGPEVSVVETLSQQAETVLRDLPETKTVLAERISEGYYVDVQYDARRMSDHGVTPDEAMLTARYAIGGDNLLNVKQADGALIPLDLQYSPEYIDTVEKVRSAPVVAGDGRSIPLGDIAEVAVRKLPEMIRNDNGDLAGYVFVDIQSSVTGPDYVEKARTILANRLKLPSGYSLEWTGLYEYATAAKARQQVVVPFTLVIIFALLVLAFRSVTESVVIMLSVPFAMVGGVFLQWLLGYAMTTAVIVGYISLFAVAVQTGIIMVMFIHQALANRVEGQSFIDAVVEGSASRLRPKLMTVAAIILSLLPVLFSSGTGMEILKPIAAPSVGGMVSSSLHVLFMTPCLMVIGEDLRNSRRWKKVKQWAGDLRGRTAREKVSIND
jgi:Cu(I)/Ag(I) efflux system membrane protein CusA/SilA